MGSTREVAHCSTVAPSNPPGQQTNWQFITLSHPSNVKTESIRKQVRSQATRNYHHETRTLAAQGRRRLRQDEIEVDVSSLLRHEPSEMVAVANERAEVDRSTSSQALLSSPGFFRLDPFFKSPISMRDEDYELCDHLLDQSCVMFRTLHSVGFLTRVRSIAFCQLLAMSSWHLAHLQQLRPKYEYLRHSITATQDLQRQIEDPLRGCTDNAICTVLLFVCCANLMHDTEAFTVHMNGLGLMIRLRGGIQSLDAMPDLRILLHWADVNGSCLQDICPYFPVPWGLLPASSRERAILLSPPASPNSDLQMIGQISLAIQKLQEMMHAEVLIRDIWKDPMFQGMHLVPIIAQLLALNSLPSRSNECANTHLEAFRLSAILYMSALRAQFGVDTFSSNHLYVTKLRALFASDRMDTVNDTNLRIWILAIAYTSSNNGEEVSFFRQALLHSLESLVIASYERVTEILKSIVWDEEFLAFQAQSLRQLMVWKRS